MEEDLKIKAATLLKAAHEYWEAYDKSFNGGKGVIYLQATDGVLAAFTRGKYINELLMAVNQAANEAPSIHHFENEEEDDGR